MVIWAWVGAILIGLSLGLLGSGGSILTVPVLVYLVGQDPKIAIASSLAIVGLISLVSTIGYAKRDQIDWRLVVWFGFPGMVGAVIGAHWSGFLSAWLQLTLFSILLLVSAVFMFKPVKHPVIVIQSRPFWKSAIEGLLVGMITGLVGVGGGFLIVPALVLLNGLPMAIAVGTSLVIITMNSASGFWESLHLLNRLQLSLDWGLIALFAVLGVAGSIVGQRLSARLPQLVLRRIFAFFLLLIGVYIFWQSLPQLQGAF